MRELDQVEYAITKALLGIYHGRIVYPSAEPAAPAGGEAATKSA
jgi:membrane-associated HD superfamily phosphohydrolase